MLYARKPCVFPQFVQNSSWCWYCKSQTLQRSCGRSDHVFGVRNHQIMVIHYGNYLGNPAYRCLQYCLLIGSSASLRSHCLDSRRCSYQPRVSWCWWGGSTDERTNSHRASSGSVWSTAARIAWTWRLMTFLFSSDMKKKSRTLFSKWLTGGWQLGDLLFLEPIWKEFSYPLGDVQNNGKPPTKHHRSGDSQSPIL